MKPLLILCCCTISALAQTANTLSETEKSQGWQLLFDGKSMAGWTPRETFDKGKTGDWSVSQGALICGGTIASWLSTDAAFSDFQLKLAFRGPENINSGVFLRSQKEGQPHVTGYELQIWDYQPAGYLTGSLVGNVKATAPGKVRGGEWNTFDVTAQGDHFAVLLNGRTVLDVHDAKHTSGVLGLQCQRENRIEFRDIKVRPLKRTGAATHPVHGTARISGAPQ
jgi:hypothetical protein